MDSLTLSDLSPSAMEEQRARLAEYDREVAALEEAKGDLDRRIAAIKVNQEVARRNLLWRELMADAEAVDGKGNATGAQGAGGIRKLIDERMDHAVSEFRRSLSAPDGYVEEAMADNVTEPVPYCDTDDYADLSALEGTVEDIVDDVRECLASNAAPYLTNGSGTGWRRQSRDSLSSLASAGLCVERESDVSAARARRRALVTLLVLSLYVGRLESLCGFDDIPDQANVLREDVDDIKDHVANAWQFAISDSAVLTQEERAEWILILENFLGPPFDGSQA